MRALLFTLTVFLGSALLFAAEPMFAKMILPLLGGAPNVWNTCVVFFQACLLGGYLYVHLSTRLLGMRAGATLHVALMTIPLWLLPFAVPNGWTPPAQANPIPWLLKLLALTIGPPFVLVTTISPLMQRWFAATETAREGRNPYVLYAASNLGSMLALVSYPVLIEPSLHLAAQSQAWARGYVALLALVFACAVVVWSQARGAAATIESNRSSAPARPTWRERLTWIALSLVPASYLLGVTTYITTDIAAVPLLWIIPLAIYLLTFIVAFSREAPPMLRSMVFLLPLAVIAVVLWLIAGVSEPLWLVLSAHLLAFFVVSMVCHGELARRKPHANYLTEYYLLMSAGGVLGGLFNALVAPVIFTSTAEYPIAIALGCMLCPPRTRTPVDSVLPKLPPKLALDLAVPVVVAGLTVGALVIMQSLPQDLSSLRVLLAAVPVAVCFAMRKRPLRFGLCIAAALAAVSLHAGYRRDLLLAHRSFFGVHTVIRGDSTSLVGNRVQPPIQFNELYHGATLHGQQRVDPATRKPVAPREPLTYYHRTGPIGRLLQAAIAQRSHDRPLEIALVGLGVGSLAAYAEPGIQMTYYEIDPAVEQIADRSGLFTFLADARQRAAAPRIVLGDARLTLARVPDKSIDVLVLDAFSGDSIPVHLLTREAMAMYLAKLKDDGVIAVHVSNRYLRLEPVIARVAREFDCACVGWQDMRLSIAERASGKTASEWVALSPNRARLADLTRDGAWRVSPVTLHQDLWTDDFSNIIRAFGRPAAPPAK